MNTHENAYVLFFDAFARWCIIFISFLIPFFVIPVSWASAAQSKMILIASVLIVGTLSWVIARCVERAVPSLPNPIMGAAILLPIAYTISALVARSSSVSFVSGNGQLDTVASTAILFGIVSLAFVSFHDAKRAARAAVFAFLIGAGVLFLIQEMHLLFPAYVTFFGTLPGNASSLAGSWHDLAIFAGLAAIFGTLLLQTHVARGAVIIWSLRAVVVLALALLLVVNFVDTWYFVSAALALYIIFTLLRPQTLRQRFLERLRDIWPVLGIALLSLGAALAPTFIFSHLPAQLQIPQTEVRPSFEGTFAVGHPVFEKSTNFIFGSGPNTFMQQWARFKPSGVNATDFWNADFTSGVGVVPTSFVTVGLLGVLAWLAIFLAILWSGYKHVRENSEEGGMRVTFVIVTLYLLAFHIIYVPGIAISVMLFLLLGILGASKKSPSISILGDYWGASQAAVAFLVVLLILCASLATLRTTISTLVVYQAAAQYRIDNDVSKAIARVNTAIWIDGENDVAQRAAVEVGLLQFQKLAPAVGSDTIKRDALQASLSETISHALAAVSIDNTNYQNWFSIAGLYQSLAGVGIQGAYDQARNAYLKAASTTPTNPLPYIQLAQTSMVQGDAATALMALNNAIALKQNLAAPYYLRSQIDIAQGNLNQATQDALAAAQLAQQDPLAWYNLGAVLYAGNDPKDAATAFERAISLQADYSNALFALGVIYDQLGRHPEALEMIQRLEKLNPNDATIKQVLANIQSGKPAMGESKPVPKKK